MKPFNKEAALKGAPVCTRGGRSVKLAGYNPDMPKDNQLLGWLEIDGSWHDRCWCANGSYLENCTEHENDLFMEPKKRVVWGRVWEWGSGRIDIFLGDSAEDADLIEKEGGGGKWRGPARIVSEWDEE